MGSLRAERKEYFFKKGYIGRKRKCRVLEKGETRVRSLDKHDCKKVKRKERIGRRESERGGEWSKKRSKKKVEGSNSFKSLIQPTAICRRRGKEGKVEGRKKRGKMRKRGRKDGRKGGGRWERERRKEGQKM